MTRRSAIIVAIAAIPAIAGALLLALRVFDSESTSALPAEAAARTPPIVYSRLVCSLANDDARAARIQGFDGGDAVTVGGRAWWMFGDTLFVPESGKQIEQNTIAAAAELRPDGCPRLEYFTSNGIAQPFLEKDGSLTVWPAGAWPAGNDAIDFYTAYVYGSGPYAYWIGEVGLARLDLESMQVTVLARNLWNADTGFLAQVIGTQPVEIADDGKLRVVLHTINALKVLARVAPDAMADASAYEYWDGQSWTTDPTRAISLWNAPQPADNVQKLATFENGASIAWNDALRKYVAVVNVGYDRIGARVADRLEGPWSEPQPWLDCLDFAEPYVPVCYSPFQHPELSTSGRSIFIALTRFRIYDVAVFEVQLATPIYLQTAGDETFYGPERPAGAAGDQRPAFYASDTPLEGFQPISIWTADGRTYYGASAPVPGAREGAIAFYAPTQPQIDGSFVDYRPVYRWTRGDEERLSPDYVDGFERGPIAFYAP